MISSYPSLRHHQLVLRQWPPLARRSQRKISTVHLGVCMSMNGDSIPPLEYDPFGFDADSQQRNFSVGTVKLRSWFGPNGQYIRELPCPSCRGRGYTPCTECGIERSRSDCSHCHGKGIRTCRQCSGDRVIWEESIDERPWEKARSSSPFKVKEDDEVDNLEIKVNVTRKSKRVYQSPSPEVTQKISRSLRTLNAKTGLFSKRMKILHRDPVLHAQRVVAIKKAKGTPEARKRSSDTMKAFFSNPENRHKRSLAMKGVKYFCSHCGEEGHRMHYFPVIRKSEGPTRFRCRLCGQRGHNRRTCEKVQLLAERKDHISSGSRYCGLCGQVGHNRRTCPDKSKEDEISKSRSRGNALISRINSTYSCSLCLEKGHNSRTCHRKKGVTM